VKKERQAFHAVLIARKRSCVGLDNCQFFAAEFLRGLLRSGVGAIWDWSVDQDFTAIIP
jgi:hypothetical protein